MRARSLGGLMLTALVALAGTTTITHAAPSLHRRAPLDATTSGITVSVVPIPDGATLQSGGGAAVAELGTVSGNAPPSASGVRIERRASAYVVVSSIGLRATSTLAGGTVALQAFLDTPIPGVIVRLDGVPLSTAPQTFASYVPVGTVTRHRLELVIPNRLDPSRIPSQISLELGATPQ